VSDFRETFEAAHSPKFIIHIQSGDEQTSCHLPPPAPISDDHHALK
jgi:hypothetical protein